VTTPSERPAPGSDGGGLTFHALYVAALRGGVGHGAEGWWLRYHDDACAPLAVARWLGPPDPADLALVARCAGPALDIGCGPGRLLAGLRRAGVPALGVDVVAEAVSLARTRGAVVLRRSVFDRLPGEGRWSAALLADGNAGIGGEPVALLARARTLLAPDGVVLVEVDPPGARTGPAGARLEHDDGRASAWFPWGRLAVDGVSEAAKDAGLVVRELWAGGEGRWFAALVRG
jgi:SAM-dependent methyltransferase